ncbi:transmembrane protein 45B-like [Pollicipes pollicipes]|uniref:transmembrane protein 45B-like n=1 Tax=Pollicipes pollicipes TaxID=41117 RepID=UPI001885543A|nr:transmembrane protein 45B-like [Pollicipes pollicipes]XP_037088077.1 transmembrane protein 45B-like [Pollicipes pollicipes]
MGTLLGHVLPGVAFLLTGLWWTYNIFERYFQTRQAPRQFQASLSFPIRRGSRVPWDCLILLGLMVVGIIGEIVTGWRDGRLVEMGNGQHATMYMCFALAAAAEAARRTGVGLVPGLEHAICAMAFVAEALLFAFHGHGTSDMEMLVHHLLLYVVLGSAAATLAELTCRRSVLPALARCFFTLLQGTWFIQVGFILFPPAGWHGWDVNSYRQQKLATAAFVWHWTGVLVAMATMGTLLRLRTRTGAPVRMAGESDGRGTRPDSTKLLLSSEDEL